MFLNINLSSINSQWVIVVEWQMSNFWAISWREQVTFWWDDDNSASSLKQQCVGSHGIPPLGHINLIPC
jgi:hypothetical protein